MVERPVVRKAMLVRVFRTFVRKAFKFVKVVPVVVVSLYVQMPVLLINFQRVEMPDERAEVVPVGYKVPALAGAVPSAADMSGSLYKSTSVIGLCSKPNSLRNLRRASRKV